MAANATSTASTETVPLQPPPEAPSPTTATNLLLRLPQEGHRIQPPRGHLRPGRHAPSDHDRVRDRQSVLASQCGQDFIPASGKDVTGQADVVNGTSCLECTAHSAPRLADGAFHGGARYDVRICVTCHNDQRRFTAIPGTRPTPAVDLDGIGVVDPGLARGPAPRSWPTARRSSTCGLHPKIHMGDDLTLTGGAYAAVERPTM